MWIRKRSTPAILLATLTAAGLSFSITAQSGSTDAPGAVAAVSPTQDTAKKRVPTKLQRPDREALRAMDRSERRAAVQAYRAARLAEIVAARGDDFGPAGYRPLAEPRPVGEPRKPAAKVAGTSIQYDSGTVTGTFNAGAPSRAVGNRYDTASGAPVENSGTITMMTFEMVQTFGSSAVLSLYSDIMGTTANPVTSVSVVAGTGLNTHTLNPTMTDNQYANGTFLAAVFQFVVTSTAVGIDTGTFMGQGFHGVHLNDNTVMGDPGGNDLQTMGNRNVVLRVSGNVVTPVELMDFEVEPTAAGKDADSKDADSKD